MTEKETTWIKGPLTAGKLIEYLKTVDPETRIVVNGYEEGFDDPTITEETITLDTGDGNFDGQHEIYYTEEEIEKWGDPFTFNGEEADPRRRVPVKVVLLKRQSS